MPESITSKELVKGDIVVLCNISVISKEPRRGTVICNKRGVRRCIKIEGVNGYFNEIGDTFVDEIKTVYREGVPYDLVLTVGHSKIMKKIRELWKRPDLHSA